MKDFSEDKELDQARLDDDTCPVCGSDMTIKEVRYGAFAYCCAACGYEEEIYE